MTDKVSIRVLIKGTGIYVGSNAVASLLSFILVFVFTKYLSPSEYGLVATANAIQSVLMILIMLNLPTAVGREYFGEEKTNVHLALYLSTSFSTVIICGSLVMTLIAVAPSSLFRSILAVDRWVVSAATITAFASSLYLFQMVIWQMANKPLPYGIVTVIQVFLSGVVGLLAVVVFELGAAGRIWSLAFANVAIAIFILPKMRLKYNLTWKIDKILLKKALAFSLPLLPHDLSSWIIRLADRIILTSLASVAMTGTYSVGVALCSPISLVADGFGRAWVPFVYNALNYGTNQSKQEIVAVGKLITLAVAFGGLTIALFSTEIVRLALPTSYHESAAVVPVISLALVASTMYRILIVPVYYVKKTALVFWATMFGALTNLVCNFLLIPHFGGVGAAWSWCIALFIQILISLFVSQKILFLPWGLRFFTPIFLATLISQYAHFFEINSVRGRILCDALFLLCILSPLHLSRTEQAYLRYCCFSNIERSNSYFTL